MRHIGIDLKGKTSRRDKMTDFCVGSGHASLLLREGLIEQLAQAHEDCGFRYVRFHGVLHDDMNVYKEIDGISTYNWLYLDKVYDRILSIGMKPFVELGFMPTDLASGDKEVFWWKGNVTPPKDYKLWYDLIVNFTQHLVDRYGIEEVRTWPFEVWNEPNYHAFFSSDMMTYFKMYEVASRAIKDVDTLIQVGGPATSGNEWVKELADYCTSNNVAVDFLSTHTYGVEGVLDEYGTFLLNLRTESDPIINDVKGARAAINSSTKMGIPLHYTEWSSSYSPRDPVHDSYVQAPFILHTLKGVEGLVDSMSYWVVSDIFEESGPVPSEFHGGFGLMTFNGYKKASYYAYDYMNSLYDDIIDTTDLDSYVSVAFTEEVTTKNIGKNEAKNKDNNVHLNILFWNYTLPKQDKPNQVWFRELHPHQTSEEVLITMSNVEDGIYTCYIDTIGYQVNDIYSEYIENPNILKGYQNESVTDTIVLEATNNELIIKYDLKDNQVVRIKSTLLKNMK